MKLCSLEDCNRKHCSKGFCEVHYRRFRKYGNTDPWNPIKRFWSNVNKTNTCWLWIGCSNNSGYGSLSVKGHVYGAHVYSFLLHNGSINNQYVLHECDVPLCVNPDHLFLGTQKDNVIDMHKKGRAKNQYTALSRRTGDAGTTGR